MVHLSCLQIMNFPLMQSATLISRIMVKQSVPRVHYLRGCKTASILPRVAAHEVPVSTYNGNSSQSTLYVGRTSSLPSKSLADNMTRKAERFDRSVLPKLNHTMAKFTLNGKIAVVTG